MEVYQFQFADYFVLIGLLLLLILISVYYCVKQAFSPEQFPLLNQFADWLEDRPKTQPEVEDAINKDRKYAKLREFLTGASKHEVLPASFSLFTAYISPMTLIGTPATVYFRGSQQMITAIPIFFAICLAAHVFVPVFHPLQLKSTSEYLELRFDERVRVAGLIVLVLNTTLRMGMWLLTPSIMLAKLSNIQYVYSVLVAALVTALYTSMGGMATIRKAENFQLCITLISLISLLFKAASIVGGFDIVIELNSTHNRFYFNDFDLNPFTNKVTFLTAFCSQFLQWGFIYCTQQPVLTRYMPSADIKTAQRILWFQWPLMSALFVLVGFVGLTMFAFYAHCDPLLNGRAARVEELAAAFAGDIGQAVPGLVGLFATGIFSGSISSLSSNLNSLSTQFFEDILKRYFRPNSQDPLPNELLLVRGSAVLIGLLVVGTVWIALSVQNTIHFRILIYNMLGAPLFGVYLLGVLHPKCTANAAFYALIVGIVCGIFLCFNYQLNYEAMGTIGSDVSDCLPYFCTRNFNFTGCSFTNNSTDFHLESSQDLQIALNSTTYLSINQTAINSTLLKLRRKPQSWPITLDFTFVQHISYHIGGLATLLVTIVSGHLISVFFPNEKCARNATPYLAPFLRTYITSMPLSKKESKIKSRTR